MFNELLEIARKSGIKTLERERSCQNDGGHFQDGETTVNGKLAWKCRCGFAAPKIAPIWKKGTTDGQQN